MDVIQIIETVFILTVGLGGIIVGIMKLIQKGSDTAKRDAIDEVNSLKEEVGTLKERMNDVDLWRKDMNGKLGLINERQKHTNELLTEQKNQLSIVSESMNSVSTSLAVMGESLKSFKDKVEKNKEKG